MAATQESTRLSRMKGYGSNAFAASSVLTSIHKISTPAKEKMNAQLPANFAMASAARWPRVYFSFSPAGFSEILLSASRFSTSSSVISWRMSLRTSLKSLRFSFIVISSFSVCESFGVLYFSLRRTEEEVRPLGIKQNERHAQQQVGVLGRLLQRDREILLQSADAVKHGVAVGIERVAGLFQ